MSLSHKQHLFVAFYCDCWNATEAAIKAGYSQKSAYSIGSENLRKPELAAAIKARMDQIYPAGKVLTRLADHADGTMEDFLFIGEEEVILEEEVAIFGKAIKTKRATVMRPTVRLDVKKGIEAGKGRLIKTYKLTDKGAVTFELYDAQAALGHLGKYHGLFKEKVEHSGPAGGDIQVKIIRGVSMDDL